MIDTIRRKLDDMKENESLSPKANANASSQQIERAGGMQIDSSFLTVKECLSEYQSLRDQQYHKLHCEWKKSLKSIKGKTWHKLYINQICHSLMFDLLHLSYKHVRKYIESIYERIGSILCIQQVSEDKQQQNETLNYVFHFYLQQHYKILFADFEQKEFDKLVDKCKQIYNKRTQCHLSAESYVLLTRYLSKCCCVSWLMILQRPKLSLYPKEFKPNVKSIKFDEEKYSKTMGSDRKSSHILYYVWPTIKRGGEVLEMKIQAIVRDSDVPMNKKKK